VRPARLVLAACVSATLLLGGCGDENPQVKAADARKVRVLDVTAVPGSMKGLSVVKEDIAKSVENAERPYFDAVTLYSLRDGEQLEATLQLGRFADGTPYAKRSFRQSLLSTIGGGAAKELRMGEDRVFLTSGDRQSIAVWFRDEYVFILSSREDYRFPRALLREALAVKP
jgi:hypothetical protein